MEQTQEPQLVTFEARTPEEWQSIIRGFNIIYEYAHYEMLRAGMQDKDADAVSMCYYEIKHFENENKIHVKPKKQ